LCLRSSLAFAVVVVAVAGCPKADGPPTAEQAAPVEKVVRDLYSGYTAASTGDQARAALDATCAPAFIASLKQKADACKQKPDATCDEDPVTCAAGHTSFTTAVVQSVSGKTAVATAVITPDGGAPKNARVTLAGEIGAWKIASIECPH
jgi:hypothetical protein